MKQQLLDLLKNLEAAVPPPQNCHHALMYSQYGSDEDGWEDKLALQINRSGRFQTLFLDEEDFKKPGTALISEILGLINSPKNGEAAA